MRKKATKDFILSTVAIAIYNGVLQLVIYPGLNLRMGAEAFGTVLFMLSAVAIMGAGFGTSASYGRIVARKERTESNGDYNVFLAAVAVLCVSVCATLAKVAGGSVRFLIGLTALMVVTVLRYYADVEYRMNIRFLDYCGFFAAVAAGYVIGLFAFAEAWIPVMLTGEAFGILYTVIRGKIFHPPFFKLSPAFGENIRAALYLSGGNILSALALHSDRLLLRLFCSGTDVTVFYAAGLIGKIVALVSVPLNGVIISYLAGYRIPMNRKRFLAVSGLLAAGAALATVVCVGVSYVFVKLMYPEVFAEASRLFFLANLGQILYFVSGTLMVVVMSFSAERVQLIINVVYAVAFVLVVIPATYFFGIAGITWSLVGVNALRLVVAFVTGVRHWPLNCAGS